MSEKNEMSYDRGFVTAGNSMESLDGVVTWHDVPPLRVWVSSRVQQGDSAVRQVVSIDFQYLANRMVRPTLAERKARLALLSTFELLSNHRPDLDAVSIRQFAVGRILEEHSQIIGQEVLKLEMPKSRKLQSIGSVTTSSNRAGSIRNRNSTQQEKFTNCNADNILIAHVYARQFAAGANKLAKRTAELLGADINVVHVALKIARRNGWLTSVGAGKSGGQLTELGELMFENYDGQSRYEEIASRR